MQSLVVGRDRMRATMPRNVWRRALWDGIVIIDLDHIAILFMISIRINFNTDVNWSPSDASVAKINAFYATLNSVFSPIREDRTPKWFVYSHWFLLQSQSIDGRVCLSGLVRTLSLRREYSLVFPLLALTGSQRYVIRIVDEVLSWLQYFQSIVKWRRHCLLDLSGGLLALRSHLFNLIQLSWCLGARRRADGADGTVCRPARRISQSESPRFLMWNGCLWSHYRSWLALVLDGMEDPGWYGTHTRVRRDLIFLAFWRYGAKISRLRPCPCGVGTLCPRQMISQTLTMIVCSCCCLSNRVPWHLFWWSKIVSTLRKNLKINFLGLLPIFADLIWSILKKRSNYGVNFREVFLISLAHDHFLGD